MIYPSPHDTDDDPALGDEPEPVDDFDDTDYGDGQPSAHLPDARAMSRIFTGRLFEEV